jgi:hypothetical protein
VHVGRGGFMLMIIMLLRRSKRFGINVFFFVSFFCVLENGVRKELDNGMRLQKLLRIPI